MRLLSCLAVVVLFQAIWVLSPVPVVRAQSVRPSRTPSASPTPTPKKAGDSDDVIRVSTELVTLTATVTDQNGRRRAGLKQSDFAVYEDGAEQKLEYFNTGDRVPVSLGIVFDTSGSMEDKIEGVRDAVEHFVKSVAPGDEIFLVRFSDEAELVQNFTDDRKKILRQIESLTPRGTTALYDAIHLGLEKLSEGKHKKRALLLLTDGNDTASQIDLRAALALARKSEVIIYALGIGQAKREMSIWAFLNRKSKTRLICAHCARSPTRPAATPITWKTRTKAGATGLTKPPRKSPPNLNSSIRSVITRRIRSATAHSGRSSSRSKTNR